MKYSIIILTMLFSLSGFAAESKSDSAKPTQNTNCVKKDKKGNCPPPPKGTKPVPKKKSEAPK